MWDDVDWSAVGVLPNNNNITFETKLFEAVKLEPENVIYADNIPAIKMAEDEFQIKWNPSVQLDDMVMIFRVFIKEVNDAPALKDAWRKALDQLMAEEKEEEEENE